MMGSDGMLWSGWQAIRDFRTTLRFCGGGTDLLRYSDQIEGRDRVLVVDAMLDDSEPGTVKVFHDELREMEDLQEHAHHLSPIQAIRLLQITNPSFQSVRFELIAVSVGSVRASPESTQRPGWREYDGSHPHIPRG